MNTLANCKAVADGIATLLFPHAEVVIHEIATQTIVHIANNFSQRAVGDHSAIDEQPAELAASRVLGPYEKLNWNGQKLRSITSVMKNAEGEAEFLLCINLNFSVLEQAREALDAFFQVSRLLPQPDVLFRDDWQERINTFLQAWLNERQLSLNTLGRKDRLALLQALYAEGAFDGRSGADYVAKVLNMGRATVYKYLRAWREASPGQTPA